MSAKQGLLKWLGAFVAFDIALIGAVLAPQLATILVDVAKITGALSSFLAPPVLFLINTLIPQDFKHVLVFWRFRNVLPAHRAFSKFVEKDPRINVPRLRQRMGSFPIEPREQQSVWFGLYQAYKTDVAVVDAHRPFLIFRDLTALSFLLALLVPALLWAGGLSIASWSTLAVFGGQYVLAAMAARQAARRFVCTVLSLESHATSAASPQALDPEI